MKINRLFAYDIDGNCYKFNYKGKWSRSAIYAKSYGAGVNVISERIGRRRAAILSKVMKLNSGFQFD